MPIHRDSAVWPSRKGNRGGRYGTFFGSGEIPARRMPVDSPGGRYECRCNYFDRFAVVGPVRIPYLLAPCEALPLWGSYGTGSKARRGGGVASQHRAGPCPMLWNCTSIPAVRFLAE